MTPRPTCACGRPVTHTIRRRYTFGVGPIERVCPSCAPAPSDAAMFEPFIQDWMRDNRPDPARTERHAA